jgi:hypothetical protein
LSQVKSIVAVGAGDPVEDAGGVGVAPGPGLDVAPAALADALAWAPGAVPGADAEPIVAPDPLHATSDAAQNRTIPAIEKRFTV